MIAEKRNGLYEAIRQISNTEQQPPPNDTEVLKGLKERRSHPRKIYVVPIEYLTADGTGRDVVKNISIGGLFIETGEFRRHFYVGQDILLNLPFPDKGKVFRVTGEVVRIAYGGIGVEFKNI